MSLRPELRPYLVLTNSAMTQNLTSVATVIQKLSMISYQFIWSAGASPVGTVGLQVSNDFSLNATGNIANAGDWSTYWFLKSDGTYVTTLAVSGNSGSLYIEVPAVASYAIRAVYTFGSGTGTLNTWINGKVQ